MKPRNVVVMLVLVLLCVVGYYVLGGKGAGDSGDEKLQPVWPKFEKPDVTAVAIRGQGEELKLRRREGSTDRWEVIEGVEFVRADNNAVDDLLTALSRQSVGARYKHETVTPGDLKGYGLDKPTIEIELTVAGKPVLVRYGKPSREGAKVYADGGAGTDVWVVPKDAMELAISDVSSRLHDKRLFDSTAFNVAKLEIVKGGATVAEVSRDIEQVWHVVQPYKGYANPTKFEYDLSRIVNVEVAKWEEFGAPDLEKYGLAKPTYEVRVTPKGEGKKAEVLEVGAEVDGGCFVKEAGTKSVARVGKPFWEAVAKEGPDSYRDNSFTRLGNAGVGIEVHVAGKNYRLEKPASTWDVIVEGDTRRPGDGDKIGKLLTRIREWQTVEFLDKTEPAEMGISDKDFVQIDRESVGKGDTPKITLLIGSRGPDDKDRKTVYAQRKGDGGLERVDAGPLDEMLGGGEQYFRSEVLEWKTELITSLARDSGLEGEGGGVEVTRVVRDLSAADKSWKWGATGMTGTIDGKTLNEILAALNKLKAEQWVSFAPEKDNDRMGFRPPKAATLTLEAHLDGMGPTDPDAKLYVGKRRPEGGYYARLGEGKSWAFVLPDEVVKTLMKPLAK
jgi:hypothetical protein